MATSSPRETLPTSVRVPGRTAQQHRGSTPQNTSPSWSDPVFNYTNVSDGVVGQEQNHHWAAKASAASEFLLPESPTLTKFQVVRGPTARTPSPPVSHQPVYFNSEEEEYGYYIPPESQLQLQLGDGFLMSHLGNGRDPSVAQQATMRHLPDQYDDEGAERDALPNNRETSFRGPLEFYSDSFFNSWDMRAKETFEKTGCDGEASRKAGSRNPADVSSLG